MFAAIVTIAAEVVEEAPEAVKNPILPVVNEMVWGAVTFFALWALVKWVFLPPITRAMDARAEKIRTDLETAARARSDAETAVETYEDSLVTAKAEAVRITEDARVQADAARRERLGVVEAEIAVVRAQSAQEIAAAKERAKADLTSSIADIAMGAAQAVVQKPLDPATETQVIEDYVNRVGSQN